MTYKIMINVLFNMIYYQKLIFKWNNETIFSLKKIFFFIKNNNLFEQYEKVFPN